MTINIPLSIIDLDPDAHQTIGSLDGGTLILDNEGRLLNLEDLSYELDTKISVTCLDKHGRMSTATAHSFNLAEWADEIYKITLNNGHVIKATKDQLFMSVTGEWLKASELHFGSIITSAIYNPRCQYPQKTTAQIEHIHKKPIYSKQATYSFQVDTSDNLLIAHPTKTETISLIPAHTAVYR